VLVKRQIEIGQYLIGFGYRRQELQNFVGEIRSYHG